MVNIDTVVEISPTQSRWTAIGPDRRKVDWDAVVREVPGEKIEWVSVPKAAVPNGGTIEFRDASGGRGAEVHATIIYRPVGGTISKLTQKESGVQVGRDLKRLKTIFEAGEISTNTPHSSILKARASEGNRMRKFRYAQFVGTANTTFASTMSPIRRSSTRAMRSSR